MNQLNIVPISKFCLSTKPEIIGNICKLERDECAACGNDVLLDLFLRKKTTQINVKFLK